MKTTTLSLLLAASLILRSQITADGSADAGSPRLSLVELTRVVRENNPAIKEAEHRWRAAVQRVRQAYAWDDPRVAGESRVRRFVDVPPNAFMDQTLAIEQLIPVTGKNLARGRAAAAEALSAFEEARRVQLDVIAKARVTYFQLANAYDQLEINNKNLISLKQIADSSRSRYETGLETAANALIAETDYSKLQEARTDLERNLSDAQSQLNALMKSRCIRAAWTASGNHNHCAGTLCKQVASDRAGSTSRGANGAREDRRRKVKASVGAARLDSRPGADGERPAVQ
jgi:outer membrane protein TolC